jgi:hypothetical protein
MHRHQEDEQRHGYVLFPVQQWAIGRSMNRFIQMLIMIA